MLGRIPSSGVSPFSPNDPRGHRAETPQLKEASSLDSGWTGVAEFDGGLDEVGTIWLEVPVPWGVEASVSVRQPPKDEAATRAANDGFGPRDLCGIGETNPEFLAAWS